MSFSVKYGNLTYEAAMKERHGLSRFTNELHKKIKVMCPKRYRFILQENFQKKKSTLQKKQKTFMNTTIYIHNLFLKINEVSIVQNENQDFAMSSNFLWNSEYDTFTSESFMNPSLIAVACCHFINID